jgi:TRAP-type mannitol/chloroaromatic compound transport system permease large subunit
MEPQVYAMMMLAGFFAMLMIGIPVAISLATVGFVFGYLGFGDSLFNLRHRRRLPMDGNSTLRIYGSDAREVSAR